MFADGDVPGNPRPIQFLLFLKLMSLFLLTVVHNWSPPFPSGLRFFCSRLWPVRRHSRFHVRGVSNQLGHMRCTVSHAHRIPLSYHFPGKLSIWILLASVILFAGLSCFFLGCPPGISMFFVPLAPACAADLSQFSPLMTTEDLGRKTTSTLLPCLYCSHLPRFISRTVLASVVASWFPGRGMNLPSGHPRLFVPFVFCCHQQKPWTGCFS